MFGSACNSRAANGRMVRKEVQSTLVDLKALNALEEHVIEVNKDEAIL